MARKTPTPPALSATIPFDALRQRDLIYGREGLALIAGGLAYPLRQTQATEDGYILTFQLPADTAGPVELRFGEAGLDGLVTWPDEKLPAGDVEVRLTLG
jgi:hypothetical protein